MQVVEISYVAWQPNCAQLMALKLQNTVHCSELKLEISKHNQ